jgi:hypothetical protein
LRLTVRIGGYQGYCCTGFTPSTIASTSDLVLIGQNGVQKRDISDFSGTEGRNVSLVAVGFEAMLAKSPASCAAASIGGAAVGKCHPLKQNKPSQAYLLQYI